MIFEESIIFPAPPMVRAVLLKKLLFRKDINFPPEKWIQVASFPELLLKLIPSKVILFTFIKRMPIPIFT